MRGPRVGSAPYSARAASDDATEHGYPFEDGDGAYVSEPDWSAMATTWQDNGVGGTPLGTDLSVAQGTTLNTVQVAPGMASVSGFHYRLTAIKSLNIPRNTGTQLRSDYVVLALDVSGNVFELRVLTGVDSAIAAVARLKAEGKDGIPLARWDQLPESEATGSKWGTAFDRRWFMGARMRPFTQGNRPPPVAGSFSYDAHTGALWHGKITGPGKVEWVQWTPTDQGIVEALTRRAGEELNAQMPGIARSIVPPIADEVLREKLPALVGPEVTKQLPGTIDAMINAAADAKLPALVKAEFPANFDQLVTDKITEQVNALGLPKLKQDVAALAVRVGAAETKLDSKADKADLALARTEIARLARYENVAVTYGPKIDPSASAATAVVSGNQLILSGYVRFKAAGIARYDVLFEVPTLRYAPAMSISITGTSTGKGKGINMTFKDNTDASWKALTFIVDDTADALTGLGNYLNFFCLVPLTT